MVRVVARALHALKTKINKLTIEVLSARDCRSLSRILKEVEQLLKESEGKVGKMNEFNMLVTLLEISINSHKCENEYQMLAELRGQDLLAMSKPVSITSVTSRKAETVKSRDEKLPGKAKNLEKTSEPHSEFIPLVKRFVEKVNVTWDSIAGLDEAKNSLAGAIYFSLARPEKDIKYDPPRKFLLYGPPGTGKTLLAAAASNMLNATFINVPVQGVLSRYVGDTPKIIGAVFAYARRHQPAVIFFDEIEYIARKRNDARGEITGALQTLLQELDGIKSKGGSEQVIVITSTNVPWELDEAFLRRMDKLIYIPLPDAKARKRIFELELLEKGFELASDVDLEWLVKETEGYSGSDIARLCRNAIDRMLRRINPPEFVRVEVASQKPEELKRKKYRVDKIRRKDFEEALKVVKPSVSRELLQRLEEWRRKYGG